MIPAIRHEIVGPTNSLHRLRIAHLSDLHLWFSEQKLWPIERLIDAWRPDVLALTGDYADTPAGQRLALAWIAKMAARHTVCWVAGNHDHWWGRSFLQRMDTLRQPHPIDRRDAWLTGKSGCRFRFTSLARLPHLQPEEPVTAPTIVLLHDPASIDSEKLRGRENCVVLAGHLHGGQITLWRDRHGRPQPAASCYKWVMDRSMIHTVPLIVSRGLGETLPLRVRAAREIVMIDFCASLEAGTTRPQREIAAPARTERPHLLTR